MNRLIRLYHTLYPLKIIQICYRLKYNIFKPRRENFPLNGCFKSITLIDYPKKQKALSIENDAFCFEFLNQKVCFEEINWSFRDNGLLWSYNLNYFDWLHQADISKNQGLQTLRLFYTPSVKKNPILLHPYPTSLRIINIAKFIAKWDINEDWLYSDLISDLIFLQGRLEYHLLANHLLENAFALYMGGLITGQAQFTREGRKLLIHELKEQVLNDGMHYERSPMYHLIILERLLDALNFAKANSDVLEHVLKSYAVRMTGLAMNWKNLDRIPMMQDSAYGIALTVKEILKYSRSVLGEDCPSGPNELKASGYRNLINGKFSLFANVGSIVPLYQPGHAHADELNFELFYNGSPIIVDTGVSTYEKNDRRQLERSTSSHNCVVLGGNSSDVWSGFRVGKRANVNIGLDDQQKLIASHDGFGRLTSRTFDSSVTGQVTLTDKLEYQSTSNGSYAKGYLHFHPDVHLKRLDKTTFLMNDQIELTIKSDKSHPSIIDLGKYSYAKGYNSLIDATVISYSVFEQTIIQIREVS